MITAIAFKVTPAYIFGKVLPSVLINVASKGLSCLATFRALVTAGRSDIFFKYVFMALCKVINLLPLKNEIQRIA